MPTPDAVTVPLRVMIRFALLVTRPASVTAPGPTNARASTVPASFGTPFPVPYGVHRDSQGTAPTGGVKTVLTVNVAFFRWAANGECFGQPCCVLDRKR